MPFVNKNHKLNNMLDACRCRELGLSNKQKIKQELLTAAEDKLVTKEHDELSCEMPGIPRSTFLMVFSPDGTKVASTHGNHNVYVTDLRTGKNCNTLIGHPRTPWCIAFHPSSNEILATGCLGGQVRIWDLSGGSEVWTTDCQTVIASLAFHPLDRLLVIATFNVLYFWDWSQPKPFMQTSTNNVKEKVRYVAFDRLGHKLITGIANMPANTSRFWERSRLSHSSFSNTYSSPIYASPPLRSNLQNGFYTRRLTRGIRSYSSQQVQTNIPTSVNNQNDEDSSNSVQERCIIQLYETLMQRYMEMYRQRTANTIDRGTDPMEPIPLNTTISSSTRTTTSSSMSVSTMTSTDTLAPTSLTASINTPKMSETVHKTASSSPQPGPSGVRLVKPLRRVQKQKVQRYTENYDASSDSSSDEHPLVLKRRIELASSMNSASKTTSSDEDDQPSTSNTSKKMKIDKSQKKSKVNKFFVSKNSAFHTTETSVNESRNSGSQENNPREREKAENQTSGSQRNINLPDVLDPSLLVLPPQVSPPPAYSDSNSNIGPSSDYSVDMSALGSTSLRRNSNISQLTSLHDFLETLEPLTANSSHERLMSRLDLLVECQFRLGLCAQRDFDPNRPQTSNSNNQPPPPPPSSSLDDLNLDYPEPVDLSSNMYSPSNERLFSESRPVDPTVDHNYLATNSETVDNLETQNSNLNAEQRIYDTPAVMARFIRIINLRRNMESIRAEMRQLHLMRYMCQQFQELLTVNIDENRQAPSSNQQNSTNNQNSSFNTRLNCNQHRPHNPRTQILCSRRYPKPQDDRYSHKYVLSTGNNRRNTFSCRISPTPRNDTRSENQRSEEGSNNTESPVETNNRGTSSSSSNSQRNTQVPNNSQGTSSRQDNLDNLIHPSTSSSTHQTTSVAVTTANRLIKTRNNDAQKSESGREKLPNPFRVTGNGNGTTPSPTTTSNSENTRNSNSYVYCKLSKPNEKGTYRVQIKNGLVQVSRLGRSTPNLSTSSESNTQTPQPSTSAQSADNRTPRCLHSMKRRCCFHKMVHRDLHHHHHVAPSAPPPPAPSQPNNGESANRTDQSTESTSSVPTDTTTSTSSVHSRNGSCFTSCNTSTAWFRPSSAPLRRVICLTKTHLAKTRRGGQQAHCLRNNPRVVLRNNPIYLRRQRSPILSQRRVYNTRHRTFYASNQSEANTSASSSTTNTATPTSTTSANNSTNNIDANDVIHENMEITPTSMMSAVCCLEDLIRHHHNQPQLRFYRFPFGVNIPVGSVRSRAERDIVRRLNTVRTQFHHLGVRLDHLPRLIDIGGNGFHIMSNDIQTGFRSRHTLSIILLALGRYFENSSSRSAAYSRHLLNDRIALCIRLCIVLIDTVFLNILERLPPPEIRQSHGFIATRLRSIHERIETERRYFRTLLARSLHSLTERSHQLGNYYIEDLSRMSVNDDSNDNSPDLNDIPTETSLSDRLFQNHLSRLNVRLRVLASRLEHNLSMLSPPTNSVTQALLSSIQEARSRVVEHAVTRARILRRRVNNDFNWRPVPQVQVNDVPVNDDSILRSSVIRPNPIPSFAQRLGGATFRPRFLHPFYGGVAVFESELDEPQREHVFGLDTEFPASVYPNHRIQIWNMSSGKIPNITNPEKNVVVSDCKIHNDASVDISQDGNLLVTLLPSGGYLNITNKLGVFSIQWDNLGQCLYTASFEQNAVSVSLSATARYLAVGLASRRVSLVPGSERCIMAQLYKLEDDGRTLLARDIEKSRNLGSTSINCIRWSPVPGQGLVYATNSGHLKVLT